MPLPRPRAQRLEKIWDKLSLSEILPESYTGEVFCGCENISQKFSMLEHIFKTERADWKKALENVKGIYLIADEKTGKKYIGSAYGKTGIWSRWQQYIKTGHGGNKDLKQLLAGGSGKTKKGLDYARENFRITLIECYSLETTDKKIIDRENFWKEALLTRTHGHNSN